MNRKNWMSALLAVMMVVSMMAVVAMPAVAADYTTLPLASSATATDEITEYQINSVAELVAASANSANYTASDVIYITASLDISTYEGGVEAFAAAYTNFGALANHPSFDGLGNTILNYTSAKPFIGVTYKGAGVKNITFDKALVDGGSAGSLAVVTAKLDGNNMVFENVHVKNSTVKTTAAGYAAGIVSFINSGSARALTMRNCSVSNTVIDAPNATYSTGFLIGRIKSSATCSFENCLAVNSKVINTGKAKEGGALLAGDMHSATNQDIYFTNVGVFNCTQECGETNGSSVIATNAATKPITAKYVYASGNKRVTASGETAMTALFTDYANSGAVAVSDIMTDNTVSYATYYLNAETTETVTTATNTVDGFNMVAGVLAMNANAPADSAITYVDWGFAADGSVVALAEGNKAPVAVTFVTSTGKTYVVPTDITGKLAPSAEVLEILQSEAWNVTGTTTDTVKPGFDWTTMTFDSAASYTGMSKNAFYSTLPLASTATANTTVDEYQINSVEELVAAAAKESAVFLNGANYKAYSFDTIYITADLDISTYPGGADAFKAAYKGFNDGGNKAYPNIDGLGHTISNFNSITPFFSGNYYAEFIRNVNFDHANVDLTADETYTYGSVLVNKWDNESTEHMGIVDNVHITNSIVTVDNSKGGGYSGIMVGYVNGGSNKHLTITNSSVSHSAIEVKEVSTEVAINTAGLMVGRYNSNNGLLTIRNSVVSDSILKANTVAANGGGLLVGDFNFRNTASRVNFENIGVFNNTIYNGEGSLASVVSTLRAGTTEGETAGLTLNGVYAAGNKRTTDNGVTFVPVTTLITDVTGTGTFAINNIKTDATVSVQVLDAVNAEENIANTETVDGYTMAAGLRDMANWGLDANGNTVLLEAGDLAPYAVTFKYDDRDVVLATDVDGKLIVDVDTLAALKAEEWILSTDETVVKPKDTAWDEEAITADIVYNVSAHVLSYVQNPDGTHTVSCPACTDEKHNGTYTCAEHSERYEAIDATETYYALAKEGYLCVCGREWTKDIANDNPASPITLEYNAATLYSADVTTFVNVAVNENVNASSFTVTVAFDKDYLAFVEATDVLEGVVVDATNAANGELTLTYTNAAGEYLNAASKLAKLNFNMILVNVNETNEPEITATATMSNVMVAGGTDPVAPLAPTATDTAVIKYALVSFTAGDVNGSGTVNLLDVFMVFRKLNAKITAEEDANFSLIAADVNNDGFMDTADAVLMLKHVTGEIDPATGAVVELKRADQEPNWVVITPAPVE